MYDTTNLVKDPSGRIKTGDYSTVDPATISPQGYEMASAYSSSQKSKPLATISTDSATSTLQSKLDKLNTYSPTTAPDYVPPPTDTSKDKTTTPTPKAYFTNSLGQEAEYDQGQLNDPNVLKFIKDNGYVMTKTEGPSAVGGEVNTLDTKITDLADKLLNYTPDNDPAFAPIVSSIRDQYATLRSQLAKGYSTADQSLSAVNLRNGFSRYAPQDAAESHINLLGDYTDKLAEYSTKEAAAITEARSSYQNGKFTQFNTAMNALERIRDDKAATLKDINKTISDALVESKKAEKVAERDNAIAELVSQGITDANTIYATLQSKGIVTNAKDVADSLKALSPGGDLDKLSGSTRDFYILKEQGKLPASVSSLPEDQQLFGYLRQEHAAQTIGNKGSNDVFTLSEVLDARKKGMDLPISVAGMTQGDLQESLHSSTPPTWFIEKLGKQLEMDPSLVGDFLKPESPLVKEAWSKWQEDNVFNEPVSGA